MLFRLALVLSSASLAVVVACGSSGGKSNPQVDAHEAVVDAPGTHAPDAPASTGLTGLGEKCGSGGVATCPANAPQCIGLTQGGTTYCTPTCLTGGTGTTNGSAQFSPSGTGALTPLPSDAMCGAAFTGGASGSAVCDIIAATTPADNPLKANTPYTAISFVCSVNCVAGACPTGMTCNTAIGNICLPN